LHGKGEAEMTKKNRGTTEISAEKLALLAEKGLKAARLSGAEKVFLAENGLEELYAVKKGLAAPTPPLDRQLVERAMARYFSESVHNVRSESSFSIILRLIDESIQAVENTTDWRFNSPAFALRGSEDRGISFFKNAGKSTVHVELTRSAGHRTNICIRLTDASRRGRAVFDAALFHQGICIESVHVVKNPVASFSGIDPGTYVLKISEKDREIAVMNMRIEK
jgi:hypothetical protein